MKGKKVTLYLNAELLSLIRSVMHEHRLTENEAIRYMLHHSKFGYDDCSNYNFGGFE